ncbi:MAG: motility protein A [Candidatus Latescibacteria bacterium]|nr:motility protein A [Candidatus Latescibacterota bacterium]
MDLATIIGLVTGLGFVVFGILKGGSLLQFYDLPSILIVGGGTIGATLINYPLTEIIGVIKVVKNAFLHKEKSPLGIIETLVGFAETARREGILSLEQQAQSLEDDFLKTGINLAVDGTEPEYIKDIMSTELDYIEERHKVGAGIFDAMGSYAPAFGMVGTLIGLVNMLASMDDPSTIGPSMAVALITTFYGALLANLVFLPIAGKLKHRSAGELLLKQLCIEGIMAIQSGDNPRIVEGKLKAFIAPSQRASSVSSE